MKRMLALLRDALAERGLALHPSKCQVQTNLADWHQRGSTNIGDGFAVEVLGEESNLVLLGTVLSLTDVTRQK
jgi:hypothetical protein